jgi:homoserine kinase
LKVAILVPKIELPEKKTSLLRSIVPQQVSLSDHVNNVGCAVATALGFLLGDEKMLQAASNDKVVEPERQKIFSYLADVKSEAKASGAIFSALSGAGPSVIAMVDSRKNEPSEVGQKMKRRLSQRGIESELLISGISQGPQVTILKS